MFVAKNEKNGQLYQFDLYMAFKGTAPMMDFFIPRRIYAKDPDYVWMKEYGTPRNLDALPEEAKAFIQKHTKGSNTADRLELLFLENILNFFVTSKHIKRGQTSRILVDNNAVITAAVEMLQTLAGGYTSTGYSPIYLGNEIVKFAEEYGDTEMAAAAKKLEKLFVQQMDQQKLRDALSFCKTVMEQALPDRYKKHEKAVEIFEKEVLAAPASEKKAKIAPKNVR